ncbi:MAG: hypothetical protein ACLT8E_03675 [Akkermansia sp.]
MVDYLKSGELPLRHAQRHQAEQRDAGRRDREGICVTTWTLRCPARHLRLQGHDPHGHVSRRGR